MTGHDEGAGGRATGGHVRGGLVLAKQGCSIRSGPGRRLQPVAVLEWTPRGASEGEDGGRGAVFDPPAGQPRRQNQIAAAADGTCTASGTPPPSRPLHLDNTRCCLSPPLISPYASLTPCPPHPPRSTAGTARASYRHRPACALLLTPNWAIYFVETRDRDLP